MIMEYSFRIDYAQKYGLEEAIVLKNIIFWILKNKANGKHLMDGRHWTYNSVRAWQELFPFLTTKQMRRTIASLLKQKIIRQGNYPGASSNRTLWYALEDEAMLDLNDPQIQLFSAGDKSVDNQKVICQNGQMDLPKRANGFAQNGKCNKQIINTDSKPDGKPAAPQQAVNKSEYYGKVNAFYDTPDELWFKELVKLYPGIDIKKQFAKMKAWLISAYPKQIKKDFKRFTVNWLNHQDPDAEKTSKSGGNGKMEVTEAFLETKLGRIATKDMVRETMRHIPETQWWKVDRFLKKRYPGSNGSIFGEVERELIAEARHGKEAMGNLVDSVKIGSVK